MKDMEKPGILHVLHGKSSFLIAAIACALLTGAALTGQTPQSPQTPVFRGGVELVTIDVRVVDKDGKPAKGLTAADFAVTLDGQKSPIRALDYLEFGAVSASEATVSRQATNQTTGTPAKRGGRVFLLLFDDLSAKPGQAKLLTISAERMLGTLDPDDLVGLTTTSGLGPVVQPTRDRAKVLAALKNKTLIGRYDDLRFPYFMTTEEAIEIDRGIPSTYLKVLARECGIVAYSTFDKSVADSMCPPQVTAEARRLAVGALHRVAMQMSGYQHVINAMRDAPSPRIVIALSSGVATNPEYDLKEQLDAIAKAAAESNVQFYALTEVADPMDMSEGEGHTLERQSEGAYLNHGIQIVANAAGGEAFLVVGQADRFFKRIDSETSGFYRLGVEAPILSEKKRFLSPKVTVKRAGLTAHANPLALVASVNAVAVPIEQRLRTALAQGGASFGVPIALATALRRDPSSSQLQLGINVQVPSTVAGPILAMAALVNDAGAIVQMVKAQVPEPQAGQDYEIAIPMPVDPGRYRVRFAVGDAHGAVGSLEHAVTAQLTKMGSFLVSDLFVTCASAGGPPRFLALDKLPEGVETLRAAVELYPVDAAGVMPDLTVRLALLKGTETTPIVERDVTPTGADGMLSGAAEMLVDQLEPGMYTIRATILESGAIIGTVSAPLHKGPGTQS